MNKIVIFTYLCCSLLAGIIPNVAFSQDSRPQVVLHDIIVPILHKHCFHHFRLSSPDLGDQFQPIVSVSGGEVKQSAKDPHKFLIIPNDRSLTLTVSHQIEGEVKVLEQFAFVVHELPKPTLSFWVNGRQYDGLTPISRASRLKLQIKSDLNFKARRPDDMKYGFDSVLVYARISIGSPTIVAKYAMQGPSQDMQSILIPSQVRKYSNIRIIFIRIKGIYRVNFQGEKIYDKRFSELERTICVMLR